MPIPYVSPTVPIVHQDYDEHGGLNSIPKTLLENGEPRDEFGYPTEQEMVKEDHAGLRIDKPVDTKEYIGMQTEGTK